MTAADLLAVRDDARDDGVRSPDQAPTCPVCGQPFVASGRARYCSRACRQRAYRLRRAPAVSDLVAGWTAQLRQSRALLAQTVYVCPSCEQRYLNDRRCDECGLFCRNHGPGGVCAGCDEIVTVAELLGLSDSNSGR